MLSILQHHLSMSETERRASVGVTYSKNRTLQALWRKGCEHFESDSMALGRQSERGALQIPHETVDRL